MPPVSPTNSETVVPLDRLLPRFYRGRGWDTRGIPTEKILRSLDLDFTIGAIPPANQTAEKLQAAFDAARTADDGKLPAAMPWPTITVKAKAATAKAPAAKKKAAPPAKPAAKKRAAPAAKPTVAKKAAPVKKPAAKKKAAPKKK